MWAFDAAEGKAADEKATGAAEGTAASDEAAGRDEEVFGRLVEWIGR